MKQLVKMYWYLKEEFKTMISNNMKENLKTILSILLDSIRTQEAMDIYLYSPDSTPTERSYSRGGFFGKVLSLKKIIIKHSSLSEDEVDDIIYSTTPDNEKFGLVFRGLDLKSTLDEEDIRILSDVVIEADYMGDLLEKILFIGEDIPLARQFEDGFFGRISQIVPILSQYSSGRWIREYIYG